MAFSRVDELMAQVVRQLGLDEKTLAIIKIWENELGPLAAHAQLVGVKEGILLVEVSNNVYLHELSLRRTALIKKINQHFGPSARTVKNIKITMK